MTIMAVIRRDHELLLVHPTIEGNHDVWTLPYFEIPDGKNPIESIIEKCRIYDVEIDPVNIYFHDILNGKEIVCFDTQLRSYTYSKIENDACWINAHNLEQMSFLNDFSDITNKLINEYHILTSVTNRIELLIHDLSDKFQLKIESTKEPYSYAVFVRAVDLINVRAYDGGDGERHSTYEFAVACGAYWKDIRGIPAHKVVLGVPFYARPSWADYGTILDAVPAASLQDHISYNGMDVYYNGVDTIIQKATYAKENLGGVMIWELTQDTSNQSESLLQAIGTIAK